MVYTHKSGVNALMYISVIPAMHLLNFEQT